MIFNRLKVYKQVFSMAGAPGLCLLGYDIVQAVFARGKINPGEVDATAILFAAYSLYCLWMAYKTLRKDKAAVNILYKDTSLKFFLLYTIWGFFSCLWSPNLALTAYRAIECFSMTFLMVSVVIKLGKYQNIHILVKWSIVYIFFTILVKTIHGITMGGLRGFFVPGSLFWFQAQFIAPIYFYWAVLYTKDIIIKVTIIAGSIMAMSTVGYIAIAAGAIALVLGDKKSRKLGLIVFSVCVVYIMLWGLDDLLAHTVFIEHNVMVEGDDSGRRFVWDMGLNAFRKQPLIGLGFFAAENTIARLGHMQTVIGMHNGFLSALVGEGIIGFVFFVLFFVTLGFAVIRKKGASVYKSAMIACYIAILIETYANPGLGFRVFGAWMPSMYGVVLLCYIMKFEKKLTSPLDRQHARWIDKI